MMAEHRGLRDRVMAHAVMAAATCVAIAFILLPHILPVSANMLDYVTFLDGAWRVLHGQVPSVDFDSAIGPLTYWLAAMALLLNGSVGSYLGMHGLMWLASLPVAFILVRQLPGWRGQAAICVLACAMLLPFNIDFGPFCGLNYNVPYNRWGSGLLFAICLMILLEERWDTPVIFGCAWCICLMAILKATFFVAALGLMLVAIAVSPHRRRGAILVIALSVLVLAALQLGTGIVSAQVHDILQTIGAAHRGMLDALMISGSRNASTFAIVVTLLIMSGQAALKTSPGPNRDKAVQRLLLQMAITGAAFAVEGQNYGGIGLIPLLSLPLAAISRRIDGEAAPQTTGQAATIRLVMMTGLAWALLGPWSSVVFFNSACLAKNLLIARNDVPLPISAPGLTGIVVHPTYAAVETTPALLASKRSLFGDETLHRDPTIYVFYFKQVLAALDALKKMDVKLSARLRVFDFADPFPLIAGIVPGHGSLLALHYDRTISFSRHPSPPAYLGRTDQILVAKCPVFNENDKITDIYRDYMKKNFNASEITPCWTLYTHKAPSG